MRRFIVLLHVQFLLSVVVGDAWGQVQYTLTDLGSALNIDSEAMGINNSGQVVWTGGVNGGAVLYSGGTIQELGTLPGGTGSEAFGINDSGQVVGESITNSMCYAVLYSGGTIQNLGTPLGGCATGINDSGQITGWASGSYGGHSYVFLYSGGTMQDLGTLGGENGQPTGINDSGQVVGFSQISGSLEHAFLWQSGSGMRDLGTLGGKESEAFGINNSGQVVGFSQFSVGVSTYHAFLYGGGVMHDLGTLPGGIQSCANGINNSGQVVGISIIAGYGASRAFLFSGGTMEDLNNLIAPNSGWTLDDAFGINDKGQIIAEGTNISGQQDAFLLSPATSTLALSANSITLRAMRNSGTTTAVTLSETSSSSTAWFSSSLSGAVTISASTGTVAASGTQSLNLGWSDYTTTGPRTGTVTLSNTSDPTDPFNSSGNVISMTGAVVDNRVVTVSTTNFGLVHVGAAVSQLITLSTTGDDNHFTRVSVGNVGPDANGISVTGGTSPVFTDSSVTDVRTLSGVFALVGTFNGSITLPTTGEGLVGEVPINVPVKYVAQVYSGQAEWNATTGVWGASTNWKDTVDGGPSGPPGIF
ncbi:MAG: hypothetical protein ABSG53_24270, partial [Thermoguttaceae bacterium]